MNGCPRATAGVLLAAACALNASGETRYVDVANASPSSPYTSWETAAQTIQDAIDRASPYDLVVVTDGVYEVGGRVAEGALTNRVAITNRVTVQSVNGPGTTVIKGSGPNGDNAVRCVYIAEGATLIGFTLTNGATLTNGDWYVDRSGGGAYCTSVGGVLSNCVLTGNAADASGGGMHRGTLQACTVTANRARSEGGGMYRSFVYDSTLSENTTDGAGAGSYGGYLYRCLISSNRAAQYAGASFDAELYDCTIAYNFSSNRGGGAGAWCRLERCAVVGNRANEGAGAFNSTLISCTVRLNCAVADGGGVYIGTLSSCVVTRNTSGNNGGGIIASAFNCVIDGNVASNLGGGVYSGGDIQNCTITDNRAGAGGGVYYGNVLNAIVFGNTAANTESNYGGLVGISHSCTAPDPGGDGNITDAPLFADAASSNYHLQGTSPCIDAGATPSSLMNDLAGMPRPLDGNNDGVAGWDMGAFEYLHSSADSDGDRMKDVDELAAGTDPTNEASFFGLLAPSLEQPAGGFVVQWHSVEGKRYRLERSTNLALQPFTCRVETNILATAPMNTATDSLVGGNGLWLYRVGLED